MFLQLNCVLMLSWLFEKEVNIGIKMDLALKKLQMVICHKTQTNKTNKQ